MIASAFPWAKIGMVMPKSTNKAGMNLNLNFIGNSCWELKVNDKSFIDFLKPSNEFWDFRLNRKGGTFTLLASEVFADYAEEPSELPPMIQCPN